MYYYVIVSFTKIYLQIFQMSHKAISTIESLPNEILLGILQITKSHDRILIWYNLNSRINNLIHQLHSWDLSNISYSYFLICSSLLTNHQDQLLSLKLSNADTTGQTSLFFHIFPLDNFHNLRSLSLVRIKHVELNDLILKIPALNHLLHLFIDCHIPFYEDFLLNDIASTSLCSLTLISGANIHYNWLTMGLQCPHLKCLKVNTRIHVKQYAQLYSSLLSNNLKKLSIYLERDTNDSEIITYADLSVLHINESVEELFINLGSYVSFHEFKFIVQKFIGLKKLSVKIMEPWNMSDIQSALSGFEWKQLISTYLPNLYELNFIIKTNRERLDDKLIDSFGSNFWIHHNW